jgi:hypothetical protein
MDCEEELVLTFDEEGREEVGRCWTRIADGDDPDDPPR